jgi:hypothetical protein
VQPLRNKPLDVIVMTKVAALRQEAEEVVEGGTGVCHLRRVSLEFDELMVDEPQAEVLVEQRNAVVQIVNHCLQHLARMLGVSACRRDFCPRGMQFAFALSRT